MESIFALQGEQGSIIRNAAWAKPATARKCEVKVESGTQKRNETGGAIYEAQLGCWRMIWEMAERYSEALVLLVPFSIWIIHTLCIPILAMCRDLKKIKKASSSLPDYGTRSWKCQKPVEKQNAPIPLWSDCSHGKVRPRKQHTLVCNTNSSSLSQPSFESSGDPKIEFF